MYRFSLLSLMLVTTSAIACQVPVFRYALERWVPDHYEVLILHHDPLASADADRLKSLVRSSESAESPANFHVREVDVDELEASSPLADRLKAEWESRGGKNRPLMVVLYPLAAREVPDRVAFITDFDDAAIESLVDSPVRRQVVKKLLGGDSAVWIFVPSGDPVQDTVAMETLQQQLKSNQSKLELPPQDEIEGDEFFNPNTKIELRIGFSILTLNRQDPREQFLLQSLLHSEADLSSLAEPMAFPVLGRGRVLYALVGKGIFRDTIGQASQFIVGPCSCQAKELNPGFDLLLSVDWDKQLVGEKLSQPLPETRGAPVLLKIPSGKKKR